MASVVQFSVDDSSPTVAYSPFGDTGSIPNLSAGWNPYFLGSGFATSPGQTGLGQSQHITSRNGASLTLNWHGTSIQLFGNTTARASFSLSLDGTPVQLSPPNSTIPNFLASLDGLPDTNHSITLTANTPQPQDPPDSSLVVFDKAVITSPPPADFSDIIFTEHTVDDNDIQFNGQWTLIPTAAQPPFHQSQLQSDTAQVTFSGISVRIFGTTSPASGNYSVLLDDTQFPILSAQSSFASTSSLLFFASGLAANTSHQITIRNEGGTLQLKSGAFIVFSSGEPTALPPPGNNGLPSPRPSSSPIPPPPSPPTLPARFTRGTIAALVLAGFLSFIILTAVLFYFCIWRPRRQRERRRRQGLHDHDFSFISPPSWFHHPRKHVSRTYRDSSYPREKDHEPDPPPMRRDLGTVLDIAPTRPEDALGNPHDDTINVIPGVVGAVDGQNSPMSSGADRRDNRNSSKSATSGLARWKRDINTLSGLTALGLKFRHSEEKSPSNNNGYSPHGDFDSGNGRPSDFIYGKYHPGVDESREDDDGIIDDAGAARMKSVSTQSSGRSFSRFGRKRTGTNQPGSGNGLGKGKGRLSSRIGSAAFPFRLSSSSRRGEGSGHGQRRRTRDDESLSGFTSLSYASNPDLAAYLDIQPPSYAASVSQHTGSGSNASSPPSVPRSVTQSPRSQSKNIDIPPSPLSETTHAAIIEEERRRPTGVRTNPTGDGGDVRSTGMHILGMGGGLAGVGGPVSMRAAIRGLSPRISKTRSGERRRSRKGKEKQVEKKHLKEEEEIEQPQEVPLQAGDIPPSDQSRSDLANVENKNPSATELVVPPTPPAPLAMPPKWTAASSGSRTGSPIRALPPIPVPSNTPRPHPIPPTLSQPLPKSNEPQESNTSSSQTTDSRSKPSVSSPAPSASFLSIPESSPFRLQFEQGPNTNTSTAAPPSSSSSSSNNERKFRSRSSSGDAAGLASHGTVQSFAEAAVMATGVINTGGGSGASPGGILVVEEGSNESVSGVQGGERDENKRLSTASRVHFEDDPTSTSDSPTTGTEEQRRLPPVTVQGTEKLEVVGRLSPVRRQSSPSPVFGTSTVVPLTSTPEASHEPGQPPEHTSPTSFLDFSSQPSSLHSRRVSEATGLDGSSVISDPIDASPEQRQGRIWSMQLPGRRHIPLDTETALKSKWSTTTMHTARSNSSSSNSGYGSAAGARPAIAVPVVTPQGSPRSNIFPFPLAIPPSPNMPEGFAGVEPSPSLMSPTASLPTGNNRRLYTETATRVTGSSLGVTGHRHDHHDHHHEHGHGHDNNNDFDDQPKTVSITDNNESPESPTDSFPYSISEVHFRTSVGTGSDVDLEPGQVHYARQHTIAHPPLPSATLTPQRYSPPQEQPQPPQQSTPSIVQRVFGGGGGSGSGSGTASPRTPLSFLKPNL